MDLVFRKEGVNMELNINETVKVKLTDSGIEILNNKHLKIQRIMKTNNPNHAEEAFVLKLDKDGYYLCQIWYLMSVFGPYTGVGKLLPFDTNIIIED